QHSRTQRIFIQSGRPLAEPRPPALPLRTELKSQLLAKPLGQSATVTGSGDRDLQRSATHNRWIVEVTKGTVADNIAKNATLLRLVRDGSVQRLQRCGHHH